MISDLRAKGYSITEVTKKADSVVGINVNEEKIELEKNIGEAIVTYSLIYSDIATVRYFAKVEEKDYEIIFNEEEIRINTEETNIEEINKAPEVIIETSDNTIVETNKIEEGKISITAKDKIGKANITIKVKNTDITKKIEVSSKISVTDLTISKTNATIEIGSTPLELTVTTIPTNTTEDIEWSSSDTTGMVTITTDSSKKKATITGKKVGTLAITVKCGSQSRVCNVAVTQFSGINVMETYPDGAMPSNASVVDKNLSNGIVIKDKNNIEWVWIVVPKTEFKTANVLSNSSTEQELNTAIKADLIKYAGIYRNSPCKYSGEWKDEPYEGCGLTSSEYTENYNKMINSVYKNGGFWIQRTEDGRTNITCATAQSYASKMCPDETKIGSLLFGIQWDLVCRYLDGKDGLNTTTINSDSTSWGYYYNNRINSIKKMNIYNFAGSLWEYTLEKTHSENWCMMRGGDYGCYGSEFPASYRHAWGVSDSASKISFRATFY